MNTAAEVLVVGAGLFGSVIAERLASDAHVKVCVIDKRPHIGGNCFSRIDEETQIECHCYGPHIFHTSNERVWSYVNRFSRFNGYRHVVHTKYRGRVYTMPINLGTINAFFGCNLEPREVEAFLSKEIASANIGTPDNLEDKAISLIGRRLYEAFVKGYTVKQWETDPRLLSPDIITRLPIRHNYNAFYFDDLHEGLPWDGYGRLFERLLSHGNIEVRLSTDYFEAGVAPGNFKLVVFTGPVDQFFNYSAGRLDWRTLRFDIQRHAMPDFQGCSQMNYADPETPFTRITEFKHFHPERKPTASTITYTEYSTKASPTDERYYPVNTPRNRDLLAKYHALAQNESQVVFGGRLGSYRYLNMDDTVEAALHCYDTVIRPRVLSRAAQGV